MAYAIAGIDVHKRMLAVVVSDLAADGRTRSSGASSGARPRSCGCWPTG
jgi:hypothetical protein